jgi:myo-inositol-1(or 4)-monophosphatase
MGCRAGRGMSGWGFKTAADASLAYNPPRLKERMNDGGTVQAIEVASEAARLGAAILLKYWEKLGPEDADLKSRNDWVSRADRESEKVIVDYIQAHFPGDRILGEESGSVAALDDGGQSTGRTWVIDPLDGTSNYLQHFPFWSISIGLMQDKEVVAGVIYEPLREIFFTGERGSGSFRNGKRMRVSEHPTLEGAFLATGFPFRAQQYVAPYCAIFQDVIRTAKGVRRAGSAALDLAYTAAGVFDGFFELHLAPWDICAGSLLIEEAGGLVTDFSGGNQHFDRGNIVGAPASIHAQLIELISHHVSEEDLDRPASSHRM